MVKRYPHAHFDFHAHNDYDQAVNGSMQSLATAKYGGKHIAHGKVIVIVGMEVKMGGFMRVILDRK